VIGACLLTLWSLAGIFFIEQNHVKWCEKALHADPLVGAVVTNSFHDPVKEATIATSLRPTPVPRVSIKRHPWLRQSISQYQLMEFNYERKCSDIDWDLYAKELKERVALGYRVWDYSFASIQTDK
jgi:hypothetical protein